MEYTLINFTELENLINKHIPENIKPLGILLGGSRLLNLHTSESDYDFDIIVSNTDYFEFLENRDNNIIKLNWQDKDIHCYVTPLNILVGQDWTSLTGGILWALSWLTRKISIEDFIAIYDKDQVTAFINNINNKKSLNKFKKLYLESTTFKNLQKAKYCSDFIQFLNNRSYYYFYIYCIETESFETHKTKILKIKQLYSKIKTIRLQENLKAASDKIVRADLELTTFVKDCFEFIIDWVQDIR